MGENKEKRNVWGNIWKNTKSFVHNVGQVFKENRNRNIEREKDDIIRLKRQIEKQKLKNELNELSKLDPNQNKAKLSVIKPTEDWNKLFSPLIQSSTSSGLKTSGKL